MAVCKPYRCGEVVSFYLSLAMELDYFTGVIYEAVLVGGVVGTGRRGCEVL